MKIPEPIKRLPEKLKRGLKHKSVIEMTVSFGVKVGHEAYLLKNKEIDYREFRRRTIAHIGGISGTTLGGAIGGIAGGWVPGVGALVGAFAGSMVGQMAGEHVGRKSAERVHRVLGREEKEETDEVPASPLSLPRRNL